MSRLRPLPKPKNVPPQINAVAELSRSAAAQRQEDEVRQAATDAALAFKQQALGGPEASLLQRITALEQRVSQLEKR
jgi:uncharacterized protein with von Willebrand factor type A (vWA) domain